MLTTDLHGSRRLKTSRFLETIYIEASDAFRAATGILLRYVRGWIFTKANPELVQRWKQAMRSRMAPNTALVTDACAALLRRTSYSAAQRER